MALQRDKGKGEGVAKMPIQTITQECVDSSMDGFGCNATTRQHLSMEASLFGLLFMPCGRVVIWWTILFHLVAQAS